MSSAANFSYKKYYNSPDEKKIKIKKNINFHNLESCGDENENEKMDEKVNQEPVENDNENNFFGEVNLNHSIFRECFNYYLSYFFEKDF